MSTTVSTTVDARGQSCPGPLVSLARALKEAGFAVRKTPVVAVLIPDRPGGLAATLKAIRGIDVEYMYAFVAKSGENAIVVFRFEDVETAVEALRRAGARILEAEDVQRL